MPKTVLLAIATLLLAVATLVTDLVSPYAGAALMAPAQVRQVPAPSHLRVPTKSDPSDLALLSSHPMS